jgi:hypothetical protein
MSDHKCPGQDQRYWKPEDIFTAPCPACGAQVEFWKDEPICVCPGCKRETRNPRIDLGCAAHCKHGRECTGQGSPNTPAKLPDP